MNAVIKGVGIAHLVLSFVDIGEAMVKALFHASGFDVSGGRGNRRGVDRTESDDVDAFLASCGEVSQAPLVVPA